MAAKKEPSISEEVTKFKDIMSRSTLFFYQFVNDKMISKTKNGNSVIINTEPELWKALVANEKFRKRMSEADISDLSLRQLFTYADMCDNVVWIEIDAKTLYEGTRIKIRVSDEFEYDHPIDKSMVPLKLRKNEQNNMQYGFIKENNNIILAFKKYFPSPIDGCGFSLTTLHKVI
jgi:hypothetical protein